VFFGLFFVYARVFLPFFIMSALLVYTHLRWWERGT
jgi:hypothetical protein